MKNKIFIFLTLALFTLFLLELPRHYYNAQDQKLLLQQGSDFYESPITSTVNDFAIKIESFFNYNPPTNGIGYTKELTQSETNIVVENIAKELKLIAPDSSQSAFLDHVFSDENLSSAPSRCFTAQVFHRQANTQYVWEVGYLDLFTPQYHIPYATIIYDTDTYKIIFLAWNMPKYEIKDYSYISNNNVFTGETYYDGIAKEISYCFVDDGLGGFLYPYPISYEYVEDYTLYHDLKELAKYFWNITYRKDVVVIQN